MKFKWYLWYPLISVHAKKRLVRNKEKKQFKAGGEIRGMRDKERVNPRKVYFSTNAGWTI